MINHANVSGLYKGLDCLEYATIPLGNTTFNGCNHQNTTVYAACEEDDNEDPIIKQSSIDVLIEERLNALSPGHKALRIMPADRLTTGAGSCSYRYNKVTGKFENLPVIRDVQVLFDLFFKAPETNTEALNKSAMDSVIAEYRELTKQVSNAESIKLEQYADEMQKVSKLLDEPKKSCSEISMPSTAGNFEPKYLAANTLISHIMSCGISKLVCYEITHYHPSEKDASAFAASHHPKEKNTLNANKDIFNRDIIQDLAVKMKNTNNNNGGNLLDDSLIYQASEDNWNHVGDGGPAFLMLGKAKGRVNAGKIYDYRIREVENFDPTDDSDHLVYRIGRNMNDSAPQFGAVGWSPYYLLLEGIMQVAGLKRNDYLLPGQFCYGHSQENWNLYGGILKKIDKFTDTDADYKSKFQFGTRWFYDRELSEIIYLDDPSNFSRITPGIFNV